MTHPMNPPKADASRLEKLRYFLYLHDKHMEAYATATDIPRDIQTKGMADLRSKRLEIEDEIQRLQGAKQ